MVHFRPQTAVIAGVGPGLGASLARKFGQEGCRVGLIARSRGYLDELASEINSAGAKVNAVVADISDAAQVQSAFRKLREKLGPIDLLINHASDAGPLGNKLAEVDPEVFAQSWRVAALGSLLCTQAAASEMIARKAGCIIFTGATSSVRGSSIAFSSAKFAVRGFAQALARELWPQGVHVAHVIVDGVIGENFLDADGEEPLLNPAAMAESYWHLATQDRAAWTLELDLRPFREKFFE